MKILMSAYACEPGKGSEPEVGWRWACEMAKYHEVLVLTRSDNRPVIEEYLRRNPSVECSVRFEYFDLSQWLLRLKKRLNLFNWYYVLWQLKARKKIDQLVQSEDIDLCHLVTFASFRYPVFLNNLAVPVVWGPVGGGEIAPWGLLWHKIRFPACIKEVVRNVFTSFSSMMVGLVNPTRTSGGQVIASTPATQKILKNKAIQAELMPTIGVDCLDDADAITILPSNEEVKFIYVGRLVLLKGVHFLLEAYAKLNRLNTSLTIVGDGPERKYLEGLVYKLNLGDHVTFMGQVPKDDLPALYKAHHVVVAPSLYESGGYMVLEGFQQCRPAIVLNVGGLALSVDETTGIKVKVEGGKNVVHGLANAMNYYIRHFEKIEEHGKAGYEKLQKVYSWDKKAKLMNRVYKKAILNKNVK